MSGLRAAGLLVRARLRRHPARWVLVGMGVALACAFAGALVVQSTVASDQVSRRVLSQLSDLDRAVRITWTGTVTPAVEGEARQLLARVGLGPVTEVALLNPVRLNGILVRPAALSPLTRWLVRSPARTPAVGRCRPGSCPMLVTGGAIGAPVLSTLGARIPVAGRARLRSAAPLAFLPGSSHSGPPVLLSGDPAGLDLLAGLSGVYRTRSWLALLPTAGLHSWGLTDLARRLQQAQATLLATGSGFALTAPFTALSTARAQASVVPQRLLLTGGGAVAVLGLFVVLGAGALGRERDAELRRLRLAGARRGQVVTFVLLEAGVVSAVAVLTGALLALAAGAVLAGQGGTPVGAALTHSVLTPRGAAGMVGAWLVATLLVALPVLAPGQRVAEVAAVAAIGALALGLAVRHGDGGAFPLLLVPLCCLAAGVLLTAAGGPLLRAVERPTRRAPPLVRLASVGLARAPSWPALAIAFVAVSIGLGGFALCYRATLVRGSSDEAAQRVPLDATVAPGADFVSPLGVASLVSWSALVRGQTWPVRRTDASFVAGASSLTVPALGVPAAALRELMGWRAGELSAPIGTLARRLTPRAPGPPWTVGIPPGMRAFAARASAPAIGVSLTALFLGPDDRLLRVSLGHAGPRPQLLRARLPRSAQGPGWRLAGLELDEPAGLEATNGHQNGENPAAATRFTGRVSVGPLELSGVGRRPATIAVAGWQGIGAVARAAAAGRGAELRFATTGQPGLLRPPAPSDRVPLPVLVDPGTAAAAGRGGELALTVDGLPVAARVAGVLRRLPSVGADAAGFILADERSLASALDAQLPGQGQADELWISTRAPAQLRAVLARPPFQRLSSAFRIDVEHALRDGPLARSLLGALFATAIVCAVLAILGLLATLLGQARDPVVERDLSGQGVGPRGLRRELRLRVLLGGAVGVAIGIAVSVLLARLAVSAVRAGATGATPDPGLVTVAPWGALVLWSIAAFAALAAATWCVTSLTSPGRSG